MLNWLEPTEPVSVDTLVTLVERESERYSDKSSFIFRFSTKLTELLDAVYHGVGFVVVDCDPVGGFLKRRILGVHLKDMGPAQQYELLFGLWRRLPLLVEQFAPQPRGRPIAPLVFMQPPNGQVRRPAVRHCSSQPAR